MCENTEHGSSQLQGATGKKMFSSHIKHGVVWKTISRSQVTHQTVLKSCECTSKMLLQLLLPNVLLIVFRKNIEKSVHALACIEQEKAILCPPEKKYNWCV